MMPCILSFITGIVGTIILFFIIIGNKIKKLGINSVVGVSSPFIYLRKYYGKKIPISQHVVNSFSKQSDTIIHYTEADKDYYYLKTIITIGVSFISMNIFLLVDVTHSQKAILENEELQKLLNISMSTLEKLSELEQNYVYDTKNQT